MLYGLVGFGCGQTVVFTFRPPRFQPRAALTFAAPAIDMPRPRSALAALDIALAQHRTGVVSGGTLAVAELEPGGIASREVFDLDRGGAFIDGAPSP